ncbi:ABC transporter substrate-binding protein [Methylobacterium sp. JK268]
MTDLSRRGLLRGAGLFGLAAPAALVGSSVQALGPVPGFDPGPLCRPAAATPGAARPLKLAWNASSVCLSPVAVAVETGIFARYGLAVDLVNFGGSTDQLLEAIATGKADAGVGMALRWLKALEQGFDVKITAGTHGGCMRLLAPAGGPVTDLKSLKGKTIAVSDMAAPGKNFFSVMLQKRGLDPTTDVEWRVFPGELLRLAVEKGEAQALVDGDPKTFLWLKDGRFTEIASNLSDEYRERTCCILGVRGALLRSETPVAAALTKSLIEAAHWAVLNPKETAQIFQPYAANASLDDLVAMVRAHTHHHHPVGEALKTELTLYAEELKLVSVMKPSTDPRKFAERIYADVLSS